MSELWWRVACFVILNHLDGESIRDAYESLKEIYTWRSNEVAALTLSAPQRLVPATTVRRVERVPFAFPDEE